MHARALIFTLMLLLGSAFQPTSRSGARARVAGSGDRVRPRDVALAAGFATSTRKKKSKKEKALTTDAGWVPLVELEAPLQEGEAKAVGRSIQGKPYRVTRVDGKIAATSMECGRCEYPLLKAKQEAGCVTCDMCGAAYGLADGAPRPSDSKGNPLLGGLLRAKPDKNLLVFPAKELDDGRVFVNINPKK